MLSPLANPRSSHITATTAGLRTFWSAGLHLSRSFSFGKTSPRAETGPVIATSSRRDRRCRRLLASYHRRIAPQAGQRLPFRCQFRLDFPLDRDSRLNDSGAKVRDYFDFQVALADAQSAARPERRIRSRDQSKEREQQGSARLIRIFSFQLGLWSLCARGMRALHGAGWIDFGHRSNLERDLGAPLAVFVFDHQCCSGPL